MPSSLTALPSLFSRSLLTAESSGSSSAVLGSVIGGSLAVALVVFAAFLIAFFFMRQARSSAVSDTPSVSATDSTSPYASIKVVPPTNEYDLGDIGAIADCNECELVPVWALVSTAFGPTALFTSTARARLTRNNYFRKHAAVTKVNQWRLEIYLLRAACPLALIVTTLGGCLILHCHEQSTMSWLFTVLCLAVGVASQLIENERIALNTVFSTLGVCARRRVALVVVG